jgi:peptidoglycan/xylan/chitin deacetylase (PgdA/CDA1 family)
MTSGAKPTGAVGGLKVLNWAGFKAAVSYNFDDANSSQLSNYTTLEALGVHYTFYLWGARVAGSKTQWVQATKDGHEMANHTQDHSDSTLSGGMGQSDVDQCDSTIQSNLGVTAYTFAEPNGTAGWEAPAMTHHFLSRGVSDGLMMPGDETSTPPNNIHCYIPPTSAPTSSFNTEIDGALNGGGWRVILVHGFTGGSDGAYQPVDINQYTAGVTYAKGKTNLWIDTMVNVGAYWRGQNAFNKATMTTSGSSTTYKWTLPANFPPGKYLRVTVTGGNITQNGTTLQWDSHGYYEISLDAGSLTLGP